MSRKPQDPQYIADIFSLTLPELQAKYKQKGNPYKPTIKDERSLTVLRQKYRNELKTMSPESAPSPENDRLQKIAELLERSGIDPNDVERVERANVWQGFIKNNDGEIEYADLASVSFVPKQGDREDLNTLFITQAAPTNITPSTAKPSKRTDRLTLCAGDSQIGFRGGEPFHDERAMDLFQQAVVDLKPDTIAFTGDMIDLPAMSRWEQRPDWQHTTQAAIDRYHSFLAQTRANAPNAKIVVVHGNHELRMDTFVRRDAAALLGIRRANAEHELSVLTLQYLVKYDELEVESIDGYPNGCYWLEDNIKIQHGTNVKKGGSNAAKYLSEEDTSTIFGHTHRVEAAYKTIATRLGSRTIAAASPGCLARIDGAVPGYGYSVDSSNNLVPKAPDWQQGLIVIQHNEKHHDIQTIRMNEDGMRIFDKQYRSDK